jgi:hypothetical protein
MWLNKKTGLSKMKGGTKLRFAKYQATFCENTTPFRE